MKINLDKKVIEYFNNGGIAVVGFSGGPDSTALMLTLLEHTKPENIIAVHVNYCLRGNDSDADEEFCKQFCKQNNIDCYSYKMDITNVDGSIESKARNIRYSIFDDIIFNKSVDTKRKVSLFLAHTQSDQVETALFNLARGSNGFKTMQLMTVRAAKENYTIFRPLITYTKNDLINFLKSKNQEWRVDNTNNIPEYCSRNIIRHKVIPALDEAVGRDTTSILSRSIELEQEKDEIIKTVMEDLVASHTYYWARIGGYIHLPVSPVTPALTFKHGLYSYERFMNKSESFIKSFLKQFIINSIISQFGFVRELPYISATTLANAYKVIAGQKRAMNLFKFQDRTLTFKCIKREGINFYVLIPEND